MKLYIWRHSIAFSSWSVMEELKVCRENYTRAEVTVLAENEDEALALLARDGRWNIDDLRQVSPEVISLSEPRVLHSVVS